MNLVRSLALVGFWLLPSFAHAATRYVATTGVDAGNACTSEASPCATLAHAIGAMLGGDTLTVADGTYAESIDHMPSGSPAAYTTIRAANDWGVTIDGSGFPNAYHDGISVSSTSYVAIRGFHVRMNQANDQNGGIGVYDSDHVKIQRCSVAYPGTTGNVAAIGVGPACDYVLVEESYAYGGARYPFLVYQSTHTVMRRNVSRIDYWNGSLQAANFTNYNGDMTVWQNNIAIDSDDADVGGSGLYGGFFNENKVPDASWSGTATRETHRGNIVLNVQAFYSGIYDYDVSNLHTYTDDIVWDSHGGFYGDYIHGDTPTLDASRFTIGAIRGTYSGANGQGSAGTGVFIGVGTGGTRVTGAITDSILWNNPSYGAADYVTGDYNSYWGNGADYGGTYATPAAGAHDQHSDLRAGLLYLTRRVGVRPRHGGIRRRTHRCERRIRVGHDRHALGRGRLRLDHVGAMWPFPNESVIKADMASYTGPGGAGVRGFTAGNSLDGTPQTLTKYIWEYLGNEIPADVYGFHVATGSLPAATIGVPYSAQVAAASGTPPYAWSLTGSLPPGLTFDASTGTISGTPTMLGTTTFTLVVTDASLPIQTAMQAFQIVVSRPMAHSNDGCGCHVTGRQSPGNSLLAFLVVGGVALASRRRLRA